MDRKQAITWIKEIRSGSGVDTSRFPEDMKGSIPKINWSDGLFSLGVEYGVMLALIEAFDIGEDDVV